MKSFLNGWLVGRREISDEQLLSEFQRFVVTEFGEQDSAAAGWCEVIVKNRGEENALASFFELFRKFLAIRVPSL